MSYMTIALKQAMCNHRELEKVEETISISKFTRLVKSTKLAVRPGKSRMLYVYRCKNCRKLILREERL